MPGKKRKTSKAPVLEEEDFVRGGGSELPPIVHKQIQQVCYLVCSADISHCHED